jgi:hypothetical protein
MKRKIVIALAAGLMLWGLTFTPAPTTAGAQGKPPVQPGDKCERQCFVEYRRCLAECRHEVCPTACDVLFAGCIFNCSPL